MSEISYSTKSKDSKQEKGNLFVFLSSQVYLNIILVCHWIVLVNVLMTQLRFYFINAIFLVSPHQL